MINVDISNIWGEVSLPDLLALEAEVSEAHKALTARSDFRCWQDLPMTAQDAQISHIIAAADQIRSDSDVLIVIGTGIACLGARAVIELLQGPNRNLSREKDGLQILFTGNSLSSRHWNELHRLLEGKDFSLCVISESGTALESAVALRNLKWILERKYGTDEARQRIYAVTGPDADALRQMAEAEEWMSFPIPQDLGTRFSTLSPAGLLPIAAAGIDISALLRGACDAQESYSLRSFENPVWLYVAVRNLLYRSGKSIEVLECSEPGFQAMGAWWQQLFAVSEGKLGRGLFPATAELTAGLYTLGQMIQDGPRHAFETMLRFDAPAQAKLIGEDLANLDGLNDLAGKTLDEVAEQAYLAAVDAHTDSGVSVICMDCGELTTEKAGELIYFFELSCGISACVLGVDPGSQPGVEQYTRHLFSLLGMPKDGAGEF